MDRSSGDVLQPENLFEAYFFESRRYLIRYIVARVDDPDLAEDILQGSLLKALRSASDLRDEERLEPWFRRIIDNAIVDTYRKCNRRRALIERYGSQWPTHSEADDDQGLCLCFRSLLPTLRKEYRVVIEAIEIQGLDPDDVARELGITRNNLNVRRHRVRQQLRDRLQAVCTACPADSYVGCECPAELDVSAATRGFGAAD